jgi:hypothetical protein
MKGRKGKKRGGNYWHPFPNKAKEAEFFFYWHQVLRKQTKKINCTCFLGKRVFSKNKGPHKVIMALAFTLPLKITCIHFLTRGVSHYGLAIFTKKYLKAKEEL